MLNRIISRIRKKVAKAISSKKFEKKFLKDLPEAYRDTAKLAFYEMSVASEKEKALATFIESFRSTITDLHNNDNIMSYSSPHSNTFQKESKTGLAKPGPYRFNKTEDTIKTGSGILKGLILKRIIEGTGTKRILELGTNTGFSGCYFLTANDVHLTTIEGSEDLCKIAKENMDRISNNYSIMNCLFDEAIDQLIKNGERFDCVFIDGQHEREATLHYTERVKPLMNEGSIFIYDDIYWSDGMNQAWKELLNNPDMVAGIDLFSFGICKKEMGTNSTQVYDLGNYIKRPEIFRPGW